MPLSPLSHPLSFRELRLELTNHCGYQCFCCPREKMTRPQGEMARDDIDLIAERTKGKLVQRPVLGLSGHGEPLLRADCPEMISTVRRCFPSSQILLVSTLGVEHSKDYWQALLSSGLDILRVSIYGYQRESYQRAHGVDRYDMVKSNLKYLLEMSEECFGPAIEVKIEQFGEDQWPDAAEQVRISRNQFLAEMGQYRSFRTIGWQLHNYGDGRHYIDARSGFPCSIAWGWRRGILQLDWDLNVFPCTFMFNNEVLWGSLRDNTLEQVFSSSAYLEFIENILNENIDRYPCQNCHRDFRGSWDELCEIESHCGRRVPGDQLRHTVTNEMLHVQEELVVNSWRIVSTLCPRISLFGAGQHTTWLLDLITKYQLPRPYCILDDFSDSAEVSGVPVVRAERHWPQENEVIVLSSAELAGTFRARCNSLWPEQMVLDLYRNEWSLG